MTEVIVFPDVEAVLIDYLGDALAGRGVNVPVVTAVPSPRPDRFVRVERTGGPISSLFLLDNPTVAVEAWGSSESDAAELIGLVRGLLHAMPGEDDAPVYRVAEFSGPGNLPDPTSGQHRYSFTASLLVRGSAL